ncbi:MAG: type II toxin-antitoxin system VapC family toxin [Candidatus Bathyarchaeota archaeon]
MKFLFDASSILEALVKGSVRVLNNNYTVEIARYELGNILWRRRTLIGDVDDEEYIRLTNLLKTTLKLLNIINIECHETNILKIAKEFKITFYDSAYVFTAKTKNLLLVTEDEELKKRVGNYVKTISIGEILKQ